MDRIVAAQVFTTIVERGSLAGAADALDMSRAMVTRYLAQMETWAGARLLHRTTRRLGLTAAGEATLARCEQLLLVAEQMGAAEDTQADEPHGMLRIACSQSLAEASLAPLVAQYLRRYPRTAVDLQISNRTVNLVQERIDLAIRITHAVDPGLIARPLGRCESVVCASPSYLAAHGTPQAVHDLATHNCLTYSYFGRSLWRFDDALGVDEVPVGGNLSANESVVLLQAALAGAGISLQPVYSAAPFIASGALVALLPERRPQTLGIHGVYASRERLPATLRTMLDFLAQAWDGAGDSDGAPA